MNLSGYKFFELSDPEALKEKLFEHLADTELKGTFILAHEGINVNIAAPEPMLPRIDEVLFNTIGLPNFELKKSFSQTRPHRRFLVKVKPEICTLRFDAAEVDRSTAQYIRAEELKAWLDDGKDFILVDTRKKFEFELGSFERAINFGGHYFKDFPNEVDEFLNEHKDKKIVTFCTGGIRCEKAGPMMTAKGFKDVYQLEGGILKYFELCGGVHWRGKCFVFDHRAVIGPDLKPAPLDCFECQKTFAPEELPEHLDGLMLLCQDCQTKLKQSA